MKIRLKFITCLVLLLLLALTASAKEFKDFSKKRGEYTLLENLRIDAKNAEFAGITHFFILGKEYAASKFNVSASVYVQTVCCDRHDDAWDNVIANFEILVGRDDSSKVHDALLKKIYEFWSTNPTDGRYVSQYNLTLKNDNYLMFMAPSTYDSTEQYYIVWINGKYMKIIFKSFQDKDGAGVTNSFWEKNIKFYVGKNRIEPEFMVNSFPDDFLKLYKAGKIKLRGSI